MRIHLTKWATNTIIPRARLPHLNLPLRPVPVTAINLNPHNLPQKARGFRTQAATMQVATANPNITDTTRAAAVGEDVGVEAEAGEIAVTKNEARTSAKTLGAMNTGKLVGSRTLLRKHPRQCVLT